MNMLNNVIKREIKLYGRILEKKWDNCKSQLNQT